MIMALPLVSWIKISLLIHPTEPRPIFLFVCPSKSQQAAAPDLSNCLHCQQLAPWYWQVGWPTTPSYLLQTAHLHLQQLLLAKKLQKLQLPLHQVMFFTADTCWCTQISTPIMDALCAISNFWQQSPLCQHVPVSANIAVLKLIMRCNIFCFGNT